MNPGRATCGGALAELVVTRVTETRLDREPGAVLDSLRRHLARPRAAWRS